MLQMRSMSRSAIENDCSMDLLSDSDQVATFYTASMTQHQTDFFSSRIFKHLSLNLILSPVE